MDKNEVKKKNVIFLLSCIFIILILFIFIIFIDKNKTINLNIKNLQEVNLKQNIKFEVENIQNSKIYITVSGYILNVEKPTQKFNTYVAVKNLKNNEYKIFKTSMVLRQDLLTKYNLSDENYKKSGFVSKINNLLLEKDVDYEVCIIYLNDDNSNIVHTGNIIRR